jgi:hypothetical protein
MCIYYAKRIISSIFPKVRHQLIQLRNKSVIQDFFNTVQADSHVISGEYLTWDRVCIRIGLPNLIVVDYWSLIENFDYKVEL